MQILELVEVSLHVEPVGRDDVRPARRKFQTLNMYGNTDSSFLPASLSWQAESQVVSGLATNVCIPPLLLDSEKENKKTLTHTGGNILLM
jgi:hypothetical protein